MRNTLLVLAMFLLLGTVAQTSQPVTFGVGFPTPPYHRWDVAEASPESLALA